MQLFPSLKRYHTHGAMVATLIALAISGMIVGVMIYLCVRQPCLSATQDTMHDLAQNARVALEVMTHEVRLAGHSPTGASLHGVIYDPSRLHLRADLNGDGAIDAPDEDVIYTYDAEQRQIMRTDCTGQDVLAEHIQAFTVAYLDRDGTPTTIDAHIRSIRITVAASMAVSDLHRAMHSGSQVYTLTTLVHVRNVSSAPRSSTELRQEERRWYDIDVTPTPLTVVQPSR